MQHYNIFHIFMLKPVEDILVYVTVNHPEQFFNFKITYSFEVKVFFLEKKNTPD